MADQEKIVEKEEPKTNKELKKELENANIELELSEARLAIKQNKTAEDLLESAIASRNIVVDEDLANGWFLHGDLHDGFTEEQHKNMLNNAYRLYHTDPHARAIVRSLVKFVLGKGPVITPEDEDKDKKIKEELENFKEQNRWNIREKEICRRAFRDGEVFIRIYREGFEVPKFRFIRPDRIANPIDKTDLPNTTFGIETNPDDIEDIKFYYRVDSQGNFKEKIPAEDIIHIKINCDSDEKRGISILKVSVKLLAQYNEWLQDRIVLNKVRSAIALIRNVDSNAAKVKNIADKNRSSIFSRDRKKTKTPARGTIITASKGISYEMLSPNINASDVAEDGRAILCSIAAGEGMPEMILTGDFSNSNYASSLIAQNPWVREVEDWQDFFETFCKEWPKIVIEHAIEQGRLDEGTNTRVKVDFPPMITADIDKLAKAFEILYKYKIISKKSWRGKMGLQDDVEQDRIDHEDSGELLPPPLGGSQGVPGGGSPFNLPIAPVNQFGQEIMAALINRDWDALDEIAERMEEEPDKYSEEETNAIEEIIEIIDSIREQ